MIASFIASIIASIHICKRGYAYYIFVLVFWKQRLLAPHFLVVTSHTQSCVMFGMLPSVEPICSESALCQQVVTVNNVPEDVDEVGCKRPVVFGFVHKGYDNSEQLQLLSERMSTAAAALNIRRRSQLSSMLHGFER